MQAFPQILMAAAFLLGGIANQAQGAVSSISFSQIQCKNFAFGLVRLQVDVQGFELKSAPLIRREECIAKLGQLRSFLNQDGSVPVQVVVQDRVVERAVGFVSPSLTSAATACEEAIEHLTSMQLPIGDVLVSFNNATQRSIDCPRGLKFDQQPNNVYLVVEADGTRSAP